MGVGGLTAEQIMALQARRKMQMQAMAQAQAVQFEGQQGYGQVQGQQAREQTRPPSPSHAHSPGNSQGHGSVQGHVQHGQGQQGQGQTQGQVQAQMVNMPSSMSPPPRRPGTARPVRPMHPSGAPATPGSGDIARSPSRSNSDISQGSMNVGMVGGMNNAGMVGMSGVDGVEMGMGGMGVGGMNLAAMGNAGMGGMGMGMAGMGPMSGVNMNLGMGGMGGMGNMAMGAMNMNLGLNGFPHQTQPQMSAQTQQRTKTPVLSSQPRPASALQQPNSSAYPQQPPPLQHVPNSASPSSSTFPPQLQLHLSSQQQQPPPQAQPQHSPPPQSPYAGQKGKMESPVAGAGMMGMNMGMNMNVNANFGMGIGDMGMGMGMPGAGVMMGPPQDMHSRLATRTDPRQTSLPPSTPTPQPRAQTPNGLALPTMGLTEQPRLAGLGLNLGVGIDGMRTPQRPTSSAYPPMSAQPSTLLQAPQTPLSGPRIQTQAQTMAGSPQKGLAELGVGGGLGSPMRMSSDSRAGSLPLTPTRGPAPSLPGSSMPPPTPQHQQPLATPSPTAPRASSAAPQLAPLPASAQLKPAVTRVTMVPLAGSEAVIPPLTTEEISSVKKWLAKDQEYEARYRRMTERTREELRELGSPLHAPWWERGGWEVCAGVGRRGWSREVFDLRFPRRGRERGDRDRRRPGRREGFRL
jgi:SWI/SNF-related matrix-associated actin-dependent regulator of chromatin subfamily B protein 1